MDTPGNAGQFEFCAGWVVGRLAWNRRRSRHEALIAMASRGGFLSHCGVFLSGKNFHMQLSINLQLERNSRLVSGGSSHWSEKGKAGFPNNFANPASPFLPICCLKDARKPSK
jgi:hypothetical protein